MKLGRRGGFGFVCLAIVAFRGEAALADGTYGRLGINASPASSQMILPSDDRYGDASCRGTDGRSDVGDGDCTSGGHVSGDASSWLRNELAREIVRRLQFIDWSQSTAQGVGSRPAASTKSESRSFVNDLQPEAWPAHPGPEMGKAYDWAVHTPARIEFAPFNAAQNPPHAAPGGTATGLFEALAIAGKKALLLILVGPFLVLRAAFGGRWRAANPEKADAGRAGEPGQILRTPPIGPRVGGLRTR